MISDNGKTFKAAAKAISKLGNHEVVQGYSSSIGVKWSFNLEKTTWWRGIFERMIRAMKRCLKKTVGQANITYDELTAVVTKMEMVLNSHCRYWGATNNITSSCWTLLLSLPVASEERPPKVSQEALSKRAMYLDHIHNNLWKQWKSELQECHCHNGGTHSVSQQELKPDDIVLLHDEKNCRCF